MGSSSGLFIVGTTKVKACKSYLFSEGSLKVENKEHLFDFAFYTYKYVDSCNH